MEGAIPSLQYKPILWPVIFPVYGFGGPMLLLPTLGLQCVSTKPILYPTLCDDIEFARTLHTRITFTVYCLFLSEM